MTMPPPAAGRPEQPVLRARRPRRPVIVWDLVASIVLQVLAVAVAAVLTFSAFFLVFASDSCGTSTACDTNRMGAGFVLAFIGPAAVTVVAVIVAIVLLVLRRVSFWVPIAGLMLAVGVWIVGVVVVVSGVPGATF